MSQVIDLKGTSNPSIQIEKAGVKLKNATGNVVVRNATDTTDAELTASKVNVSGNSIVLNSDAVGTGNDYSTIIQRSSTQAQNVTYTLPIDDGSPSQYLQTDGSGILTWGTVAGSSDKSTVDTTSLAFGSPTTVTCFTLPVNAVVEECTIVIDTTYTGTPSLSVGITGTTSKYMSSNQVDLTDVPKTRYTTGPGEIASGTTESIIVTYAPGGSTVGASRLLISYSIPA